jgi:hypothetical protein
MSDIKMIMIISPMRKAVRDKSRQTSMHQRDLNPQSQETSGSRPTPYTSFTLSDHWIGLKNGYIEK